ncbi:unnamed protein product [Allacma fusca]|uniref:Cyclin-dependent kinases regulatory subunit n=2 Tax=Allacma fusca TaxID=39272 RepID=A0A8J2PN64_9HEXA|nr:unnamed protein product [Allacma fusca]
MSNKEIYYSSKYTDELYEYRHVIVPKEIAKSIPRHKLMTEAEWRAIGVQQSPGWIHYMNHDPEPHILLFRRKLTKDTTSHFTIPQKTYEGHVKTFARNVYALLELHACLWNINSRNLVISAVNKNFL